MSSFLVHVYDRSADDESFLSLMDMYFRHVVERNGQVLAIHSFIHSFIPLNSGSKAHKTTDKSSDIMIKHNKKAVLSQR